MHPSMNFQDTKTAFAWQSNAKLYESYLVFKALGSRALVQASTRLIATALRMHLPITPLIKMTVFRQFCGGVSAADSMTVVEEMARFKVGAILDYSVEALNRESDFDAVLAENLVAIRLAGQHRQHLPMSVFKLTGLARFELLERITSGASLSKAEQDELSRVEARIDTICSTAAAGGVPILFDAEESWIQAAIDGLALKMMHRYNRKECLVYNTLQMYRVDRLHYLQEQLNAAKAGGYFYGAKLVRGAYMEKERERAQRLGLSSPIQPDKSATDRDFDAALQAVLAQLDHAGLFLGTHNELSTRLLVDKMREQGIAPGHPRILFSQLFGMSDHLSYNLAAGGYRVAKYLPYGPVKAVLPYLFRRAEENTSIQGQAGRELQLIRREIKRRGLTFT